MQSAHAELMFEGLCDVFLYKFIDDRPPDSIESLRAKYEKLASRKSPDGTQDWLNWAVWSKHDARYIGYVQATVRGAGLAEIAYVLFRDARGKGFGREAVGAMVSHLRNCYAVTLLQAVVDPRNTRSVALLQALAFKHDRDRSGVDRVQVGESLYVLAFPLEEDDANIGKG